VGLAAGGPPWLTLGERVVIGLVLAVGPNESFLSYIADVLPAARRHSANSRKDYMRRLAWLGLHAKLTNHSVPG